MASTRVHALVPVAFITAIALLPTAAAQAAPPTLLTAGSTSRHLTATWSLPPGVESSEVEFSHSPATSQDGSFKDFVDTEPLDEEQRSWRSEDPVSPGIYYVHVSGSTPECVECPIDEWSNVLRVVVPVPIAKPGRYSGRTEPASKPFSFILATNLRSIRSLKFSYELDCTHNGFPVGQLRGTVNYKSAIRVLPNRTFSRVIHYPLRFPGGPRGSATVTVKGKLNPPTAATGTLRARAGLSGGVSCRDFFGTETWSATRR